MDRKAWAGDLLGKIAPKMVKVVERNIDRVPYIVHDGRYDDWSSDDRIGWWTNGFWGGILWECFHLTGNELFRNEAIKLEEKMDPVFFDYMHMDHDAGFRWLPTAVAHYRYDGNEKSFQRGLAAANNLAGRFNLNGNYIRAWNHNDMGSSNGIAIIDCMMNLPLLYWASDVTEDPRFAAIARRHADTAMEHFIRGDGSSCHIVNFDCETGECLGPIPGQGFSPDSSWSRGQSWAIYGFALSYRHTHDERYLATSKRVANYIISNLGDDCLIPCDYRQDPNGPFKEDDTAAAITACGLIELSQYCEDVDKANYLKWAYRILDALVSKSFTLDENVDNLLEKGTVAYHFGEQEVPINYGDYYFIEALMKIAGNEFFIW